MCQLSVPMQVIQEGHKIYQVDTYDSKFVASNDYDKDLCIF